MSENPGRNALLVIASANMADADTLRDSAEIIERHANNGYYDDDEGGELLKQIAAYFRRKAV